MIPGKIGDALAALGAWVLSPLINAYDDGYNAAKAEASAATADDAMGFSALFIAKEAVASYNIEHPDKPITLREYFISQASATTPEIAVSEDEVEAAIKRALQIADHFRESFRQRVRYANGEFEVMPDGDKTEAEDAIRCLVAAFRKRAEKP